MRLKSQLNLLAVGVILGVSLFVSLAAVMVIESLAHDLGEARLVPLDALVLDELLEDVIAQGFLDHGALGGDLHGVAQAGPAVGQAELANLLRTRVPP